MTNVIGSHMAEGQTTNGPPLFFGSNYNYWKIRMRIYIQDNDYVCWIIIENGPIIPHKKKLKKFQQDVQKRSIPKKAKKN